MINSIVQRENIDHCPVLSGTVRDFTGQGDFLEFWVDLRAVFETAGVNDHAEHVYELTFALKRMILSIFGLLHIFREFFLILQNFILSTRLH